MISIRRICLLVLALSISAVSSPSRAASPGWVAIKVGDALLAVPEGWRNMDDLSPELLIFRQGDGIVLPALDETGAPLQSGIVVERYSDPAAGLDRILQSLTAYSKRDSRLVLVRDPVIHSIVLSDGSAARLMVQEFIKNGGRRSLQMKLVCKPANGAAWIISGFLVGGKESSWPKEDSPQAAWLTAHLLSFTLDPKKFDSKRLADAYSRLPKADQSAPSTAR